MAEIPTYTLTAFKALKVPELRQLKCCEITADGTYLFTFINPQTDFVKLSVENMGLRSNNVGGRKTIEELTYANV